MSTEVWVHASELLTGSGVRAKDGRKVGEDDLGRIDDGAIAFSEGRKVIWVGPTSELPKKHLRARRRDLRGRSSVVPGLVDCHTHLVFAGDRSAEFAARCGGATYEEIAAKGGGIVTTVQATRNATPDELLSLAIDRVREMASFGVRTIEIKSGYGLSLEAELKQLEVVEKLRRKFPGLTFSATFLGAHAFPPERTREDYLDELLHRMLPEVARKRLADSCDVFSDVGYFSVSEAESILRRARALRLAVRLHADELANTESAVLAARLGALSADHLLRISGEGIRALAGSQTVAVLLPGTAFYLKAPHAPARALIEAGACVALATDFNPGSCMTTSLPAILTLAALYLGMSRAEIFAAITYNGAKALDLHGRKGTLEPGMDADVVALPFPRFEDIYYRFAWAPRKAATGR